MNYLMGFEDNRIKGTALISVQDNRAPTCSSDERPAAFFPLGGRGSGAIIYFHLAPQITAVLKALQSVRSVRPHGHHDMNLVAPWNMLPWGKREGFARVRRPHTDFILLRPSFGLLKL